MQFDHTTKYKKGRENIIVNALSKTPSLKV